MLTMLAMAIPRIDGDQTVSVERRSDRTPASLIRLDPA
jgi:hypothetical protein